MSVIANSIIQQNGLVYYFDAGNLKCYRGDATINTIPNPSINAYPTIGNGWGSYNTNQYNGGAFFSIGTVSSISSNIVTMSANHSLRSYDVMRPQTTGGGLTANTDYLVKKLSATTFSLHSYNSSQDGSQGYISATTNTHKVYDSFANDTRVAINATSFPTMWWGAPHLPNSGLVKEIITGGYNVDLYAKTDCIRLHYIRDDDVKDGMSYSVDATVTPGVPNTHSCWARAITPSAVGKTVNVSIYNYGANAAVSYGYSITLGALGVWQRFTNTFTPVNANIISYWFGAGSGTYKWDLANIQVEAKGYATRFVAGTRGTTVATSGGAYDLSGNSNHGTLVGGPVYSTLGGGSLTFDGSDDYVDLGTNSSIVNVTNNITVIAWIRTASPNSRMTIYGNGYGGTGMIFGTSVNTPGGLEVYYPSIWVAYSTGGVLQANTWQQVCYTRSGTGLNTHAFYINGVAQTVTQTANGGDAFANSGTNRYIGLRSGVMMNGNIATLGVYNRNLTAAEVLQNFNATKGRFGL